MTISKTDDEELKEVLGLKYEKKYGNDLGSDAWGYIEHENEQWMVRRDGKGGYTIRKPDH